MGKIGVILNAAGGSFSEESEQAVRDAFSEAGLDADIRVAREGADIDRSVADLLSKGCETIVAGGGDGTISTVASALIETGKTLGVLPLGTLNNFSRDLGIPQTLPEAVAVIRDGETVTVDTAEVNGRAFINNSSIGLYPQIVRKRDQQQERLGYGKWWSAFWAMLRVFRFARFLRVRIEVDGKAYLRKTPFVFVGNNRYEMDLYNIGRRTELDAQKLSVYFLHRGGRFGVIMLLLRTLTGTVRQWRDFEEVLTGSVTIQTRRKRLLVAMDGEVEVLETPLEYRMRSAALKVIAPRAAKESE